MIQPPLVATIAALAEAAAGYPQPLYRLIGHPVSWIGALIGQLDRRLNSDSASRHRRRMAGLFSALLIVAVPTGGAFLLQEMVVLLLPPQARLVLLGLLAATLPAQRSLYAHVRAVATARDLESGRNAVSLIVGRDTQALDQSGVSRAAIESLAENFSDGVVAPLFWCALFGLPGMAFYKAVNTTDSMIGHRTERHEAFGWAAARLDDLVNLPASRLSAGLLILSSPPRAAHAMRTVLRDAGRHRSPNAGWPEAAMAGALDLRLAGPRRYHGAMVEDHWMGDGRAICDVADIRRALVLYRRACVLLVAMLLVLDLVLWRPA
ncbi:adenosylcobinamide-phosphate synthase CbiB [Acetobacteraceae bacterium KSS8]|uniref:Cobalamin biosynthesis protein CobD n=1 Tax=Endosaccharibacter trunci TaxID=2812733 RepID=A0ABT1W7A0_9PROT|nr:adenosylcobinamide-phosphate synthase CbiB [Acetobacteraceae bacterium KSS8]